MASDALADRTTVLIDALRGAGWCHLPDYLDAGTVAALRADALDLRADFREAAVGRAQARQRDAGIRSDATRWLDAATPAQRTFLEAMETLRLLLNRCLYLGLFDYEAHYAHYPPGAFYRRHRDVFRTVADGKPRRLLSTVFYLNESWGAGDGGELLLYDDADREIARIAPLAGSAVFFLSDEIPHEVLPARADRYSIAGWFRVPGSTAVGGA